MTITPDRSSLRVLLLACAATILLWFVPLASQLLYPIRLFVTFIHEGGHALAALLTGGAVERIVIHPDGSGMTLVVGGFAPLVLMAGYLGATAYGAGLLWLGARRPASARRALLASAALVGLLALLFVRPWENPFGFGGGIVIALGLLLAARRLSARGAELATMFLGVQCALNALFDLRTLIGLSMAPGAPANDAMLMARLIPLPPVVWALFWGLLALGIVALALRPYWRAARGR